MKLWLISQSVNNDYDTYDAAVVAAETEEEAKKIHPCGRQDDCSERTWADPKNVKAKLIGEAVEGTKAGVVLASFNAG